MLSPDLVPVTMEAKGVVLGFDPFRDFISMKRPESTFRVTHWSATFPFLGEAVDLLAELI